MVGLRGPGVAAPVLRRPSPLQSGWASARSPRRRRKRNLDLHLELCLLTPQLLRFSAALRSGLAMPVTAPSRIQAATFAADQRASPAPGPTPALGFSLNATRRAASS